MRSGAFPKHTLLDGAAAGGTPPINELRTLLDGAAGGGTPPINE